MKTFKYLFLSILSLSILVSCSSDDDNPDPVNEEEIITTVRLELTPTTSGETVVFQSQDLDGDGPNAPVVTITGNISASTVYDGEIEFLNELEDPAEDITLEVLEEGDEHQVFYTFTSGNAGSTVIYNDQDEDGNPIGVDITFNSGVASTNNTLVVVLRHEPSKTASGVSDGDITNAGGATDAEVTFTYDVN
ncbi:type 1 periplasmic binding fold superfamily protein [uncultured Winogradskyella sp.]|uniref:type 1 periplasmic binding fold superfamily protein n=1 Tax=uncultured Winogradskyella sp. TaxID=395353 RepID=UPI0026129205|nr:type 1 periplasmic binding fold superfamily protein [uncultured Winogradskyella sp.]|tara:strand:- start:264 stop:839 length:576 start_codon:yes stop_codon:yes gene_type:complete